MVLITSAKYVNPELQSEFGKIPPSFLPLGGKRLYEYQVKLFKDQKIILSLPQSFKITISDQKKLEALHIEILYIPENLSLGESIVYAVNMNLPLENNLQILHGDTYFENLELVDNSISSSLVESNYDWTYVVKEGKHLFGSQQNQTSHYKDYILSGYFNIKHPYSFIQAIVKNRYVFIDGLVQYTKEHPLTIVKNDTWLDFGLVSNYFHSKKSMTTERAFNSLVIKDGYVTKSSTLPGKLDAEINWFTCFPKSLSLYVPRFYANEDLLSYKTEYLYTSTLSELYVFGQLPLHVWNRIFLSLQSFLSKLHSYNTEDKEINFNYLHKSRIRIKSFSNDHNISLNKAWTYNGYKMPSIDFILNDLEQYIDVRSDTFKFIHGDFCFSNIMYDFKSNEIKTFDPRGIDFNNKVTVYGDNNYDVAKLMHSVIGLYDYIISEFYECNIEDYVIDFKIDIPIEIKLIQESFFTIFDLKNKNEVYAIMIHLFISMLPLHNDNVDKQHALLANMFRLYKNLKEGL